MLTCWCLGRDRSVITVPVSLWLIVLFALSFGLTAAGECQAKNTLWRISSGDKTVFLLGSIHFLKKSSYPLDPAIERAFEASEKIALEIDLQPKTADATRELAMQRGIYLDGTMLRDHLSSDTYQSAERHLRQLGLEIQSLNPLKPWLVAFTIL